MWTIGLKRRHVPESDGQEKLEAALGQYSLFVGLDSGRLAGLSPALRVKDFRDEEIVCHCPDASHDAFMLLAGVVAVTIKKNDLLHTVQLERPGAVFNVGPLVGLGKEPAGVRALGSVQIVAMDNTMLGRSFTEEPALGYRFLRNVCRLALDQYGKQMERLLESS